MLLYKYQVKYIDSMISVGDNVFVDDENRTEVKIITIIRIDTDEMIVYFYGVPTSEIDETD